MTYDEFMRNLPVGYISRRKRANVIFIYSVYAYCIFQLSIKFNLVKIHDSNIFMFINYGLIFFSFVALMYYYSSRRMFNKIKMYNHNEFKVFTNKERLLYILPVILSCFFIMASLLFYFMTLGVLFLIIQKFNKPVEPIDKYM